MSKKPKRKSSGRMASKGFANPIDIHVGARIRLRRTLLGMSQEKLADAIGLTFQQVQKYERGANRVGSSRLFDLAKVLDVQVSYFFEEMANGVSEMTPSRLSGASIAKLEETRDEFGYPVQGDPMMRRETLELVRAYYKIGDPSVRKRIADLTKAIAKEGRSDEEAEEDAPRKRRGRRPAIAA